MMVNKKLKTLEELVSIIHSLRDTEKTIVTTNGAFDILHVGHVHSLTLAKQQGDVLVVCLNSDSSIKQYKSPDRPIFNESDRATMLAALECVDYVTIFSELDPRAILEAIKPNYHVKSQSGYKGLETESVEKYGGKIVLIDDMPGYSTTAVLKRLGV